MFFYLAGKKRFFHTGNIGNSIGFCDFLCFLRLFLYSFRQFLDPGLQPYRILSGLCHILFQLLCPLFNIWDLLIQLLFPLQTVGCL